MEELPEDVRKQHKTILSDITVLEKLEIAFSNTIHTPVVYRNNTAPDSIKAEFSRELQLHLGK